MSALEGAPLGRQEVYRPSPVNRVRRTQKQLASIDDVIVAVLTEDHPATLRGTFYRVMSAGAVEKTENGYKLVARQLLKLRRAGTIPNSWITDGTRYIVKADTWRNIDAALLGLARQYRRRIWASQEVDVHMFTKKDALTGLIQPITDEYDVPLGVLRGYSSESFAWSVAESLPPGRTTIMYQLGDHDPSGIDAWRSFADKVGTFAPDADVRFVRLAVTPEQITLLNLPTRPTKRSDTRAAGFIGGSVEVDAIPPHLIRRLVREAIEQHLDQEQLVFTRQVEAEERDRLRLMITRGSNGS